MRYFDCSIPVRAEVIKEKTKIRLRDYSSSYDDIAAGGINGYFYKNMKNDMTFFIYREEEEGLQATFSFDDKKTTFEETLEYIIDTFKESFVAQRLKINPEEATMFDYFEHLLEARRRECIGPVGRMAEISNCIPYDLYRYDTKDANFNLQEKIISSNKRKLCPIYDPDFVKELKNIEEHKLDIEDKSNLVHYVISSGSLEAAIDMADTLAQKLIDAGRLRSRRIGIFTEIQPFLYKRTNSFEDIIENNYGGAMIIDLSTAFGHKPSEYMMTSEYILKILKRHKNDCLFIFTYNKENPGFAFQILPEIYNYVVPIMLKEGRGDRAVATKYMRELIKNSDYSEYAKQAKEYLEHFPGEMLSQTDIVKAYDQFGIWCIKKNILKAYDNSIAGDFMLDRDEDVGSPYEKLQNLIGLEKVKKKIDSILASNILEKKRKNYKGSDYEAGSMHMIFAGNPGTAKTTVAKLFARIAKEKGILKSGAFIERGGMDLNYYNPEMLRGLFREAKGGVLFIDEAYALCNFSTITTLVQEMENHRDSVILIFAGYSKAMSHFIEQNEGLKSRIPYWVDFPDYSADELTEIFKKMTKERGFTLTEEAVNEAKAVFERARVIEGFGNGRYARNLLDQAIQNQAKRLISSDQNAENISEETLFRFEKEDIVQLEEGGTKVKERPVGSAYEELKNMIGLNSVKELVDKAIAHCKMNKLCMDRGIHKDKVSMHMVFTGNPGTAKTTVARLLAEILRDEKILPSGKFVEAGRADLVGQFVGHTAPLVKRKFKEAKGGILFIDEAYSLCDDNMNSFGDEAINTIVQEMENNREDTIVIFAGYPEPMREFLERNPGMTSRIAFKLHFEDYTVDELCDITKLMVKNKEMSITEEALAKLREQYEAVYQRNDYGNGRYVRQVLEEAEMNLAERLIQLDENEITTELVTTIEECDIPELEEDRSETKSHIGFMV